jgi:hypothetical protein
MVKGKGKGLVIAPPKKKGLFDKIVDKVAKPKKVDTPQRIAGSRS